MGLFCIILMFLFDNWNKRAVFYTVLHGGYGMVWFLKSFYLPDDYFNRKTTFGSCLIYCTFLVFYYFIPYTAISDK